MTDSSVQPDPWAQIAVELHRIADDAEKLIGHAAPGLVALDIQPFGDVSHPPVPQERATTIQAVDDVAFAIFDKVGETHEMSGGTFHHKRYGRRGRIQVNVYQAIANPAFVDKDEEIARLRTEVEQLRALRPHPSWPTEAELKPWESLASSAARYRESIQPADPTGLSYSRSDDGPDDPTPVSPARGIAHVGGMTNGGLVDESGPTVQFGSAHWGPADDAGVVCQGAPAGYEADCGIPGAHGPHPIEAGRVIGRAPVDGDGTGLIVGDTADEQRDNAYAAYDRDEGLVWDREDPS